MSRQKRQLSQSGLYHIIFRGISGQNIFEEAVDYVKLKEIIKKSDKRNKCRNLCLLLYDKSCAFVFERKRSR